MRRVLGAGLAVLAGTALMTTALGQRALAAPVPVVVIDGKGWGHGVGMAQDGAYWMARGGANSAQILAHFYPGTRPGRAGGQLRVPVLSAADAVVAFPGGGEVRDAREGPQSAGFPLRVPAGGRVRLRDDGHRYAAEVVGGVRIRQLLPPLLPPPPVPLPPVAPPPAPPPPPPPPPPTTAPPPPGRATSARPLWAVPSGGGVVAVPARGRSYRGMVEASRAGGGLRLVNHVDVEQYLRGMGEVPAGWPQAALRAQAVAARTYALQAARAGLELCDDESCQVYLGAQAEHPATNQAAAATSGQVLMFGRALASTVYSANAGGMSATPEEGFGTPNQGYPYLRAAAYPTQDPFPWSVKVSLGDVGRRVGYPGEVSGVRVSAAGPSGRAQQVTVDGSAGSRAVSGIDFDRALGLRSTLFSVRVETSETPPPPPPPDTGTQVLVGGAAPAAPGGQLALPAPDPATDRSEGGVAWGHVPLLVLAALLATAAAGGTAFVAASGPRLR